MLHDPEAAPLLPEDRVVRHSYVLHRNVAVIRRHVEGPEHLLDFETGGIRRDEKRRDAQSVSGLTARSGEDEIVLRFVDPGIPCLLAVDAPLIAVPNCMRLHVRGVGTMLRFGDPEREAHPPFEKSFDPLRLLLLRAVVEHQKKPDVVPDDRVLVLQIVVEPEPLGRQVLANHGHAEIGAVLTSVFLGIRIPIVARRIRDASRLGQQRLPPFVGQTTPVPIGACVLAAMVEEPDVVVPGLERLDLPLDEIVQGFQIRRELRREIEIHGNRS